MAAIDLSPLRRALAMLVEARRFWLAEDVASPLKPHLRSAVIQSFEFSYELSLRMLRRVLIERAEARRSRHRPVVPRPAAARRGCGARRRPGGMARMARTSQRDQPHLQRADGR